MSYLNSYHWLAPGLQARSSECKSLCYNSILAESVICLRILGMSLGRKNLDLGKLMKTEKPGGLQFMGWQRVGHDRATFTFTMTSLGFPGGSDGKGSACNAGDLGLIPRSGGSPGEGSGNPLQYSCLENSMDSGTWWAAVHGVAKSWTRLSN